jgi:hypothetical protein
MTTNFVTFSAACQHARNNLIPSWLAGGKIQIYTASRPDTPDTEITTQVKLAEHALPDPAGSSTDNVFTTNEIPYAAILHSGTPAWGRILDSSGNPIGDGDVGTSDAMFVYESLTWIEGGNAYLDSLTITESG